MTNRNETILDENGFELNVNYDYERTEGYYAEIGNPSTWVESTIYTELKIVEIVFSHKGIDILPMMDERQKMFIGFM